MSWDVTVTISEALRSDLQRMLGLVVADVCASLRVELHEDNEMLVAYIIPRRGISRHRIKSALGRAKILIEPQIAPRVGRHSWQILVTDEPGKLPVLQGEYSEVLPGDLRNETVAQGADRKMSQEYFST